MYKKTCLQKKQRGRKSYTIWWWSHVVSQEDKWKEKKEKLRSMCVEKMNFSQSVSWVFFSCVYFIECNVYFLDESLSCHLILFFYSFLLGSLFKNVFLSSSSIGSWLLCLFLCISFWHQSFHSQNTSSFNNKEEKEGYFNVSDSWGFHVDDDDVHMFPGKTVLFCCVQYNFCCWESISKRLHSSLQFLAK